jgi:hypothetical protein
MGRARRWLAKKKHKITKHAHTAQVSDNTCQVEADVTIAYSAT